MKSPHLDRPRGTLAGWLHTLDRSARVLALSGCLALGACAPQAPAEDTTQVVLAALTPDQEAAQARFLTPHAIAEVARFRADFEQVSDLAGFRSIFDRAMGIETLLVRPDSLEEFGGPDGQYAFAYEFGSADLGIPGVDASCIAECTESAIALNREGLQAAAAATPSTDDDQFVALLFAFYPYARIYEGEIAAYPAFMNQTWDYGGYSTLGSGTHRALVWRLGAFSPESAFGPTVAQLRETLADDIVYGMCFGPPAADVVAELQEILALDVLTATEREAFSARARAVENGEVEYVNCAETFDCGNCTSG